MDATTPPRGARAMARAAMTSQVADIAIALFLDRGFDATTVDDICSEAGISRTSFFRYFSTKEDIVLRDFDALADPLLVSLTARPEEESAWDAMLNALIPLARGYTSDARVKRVLRLVVESPTLSALHHEKLRRWSDHVRPELTRRLGSDPTDPADPLPAAVAAAAFACLDAAITSWLDTSDLDLIALLQRAQEGIRPPR